MPMDLSLNIGKANIMVFMSKGIFISSYRIVIHLTRIDEVNKQIIIGVVMYN